MQVIVKNEDDMLRLGNAIAQVLASGDVVYLRGVLGAGKTTLVRGVARGKGYRQRVTSPSFTLMNIYPAAVPLYHFDFYRLEPADLSDLGLEDYLERDGICLIEWPEIGLLSLPGQALYIDIDLVDNDYDRERLVSISGDGESCCRKIKELERLVHTGC
ncbi:MAG: tRNA (adenosine(37)-N6)-threonylcarbamoyltransferase complex ATPase subunit type 1 TsaE [Syntrophomonadaceae bacterium]